MKKPRHNSKEWLSDRKSLIWDFRIWQILCIIKLLLVILFIYSIEQTLASQELQRIGYLALIIVLLTCIKELQTSQASIQLSVSRVLTHGDTFHFLEIIPGKAFRIHFRENRIYKQRISRFKKLIREARRQKHERKKSSSSPQPFSEP